MIRRFISPFTENPLAKTVCLTLSVLTWLYVQGGQVGQVKMRVPIDWTLPNSLITQEALPSTVQVNLSGAHATLRRSARSDLRLVIDLSEAGVGATSVEFANFSLQHRSPGVTVDGFSPSAISFTLDTVSVRKTKVRLVALGEPAKGYEVVSMKVVPEVVDIRGQNYRVSELLEVKTLPIDLSGLTADTRIPVQLDLPRGVALIDERVPEVVVEVKSLVDRALFSEVQVMVPADGRWSSTPRRVQVTLEGPTALLQEVANHPIFAHVQLPEGAEEPVYSLSFSETSGPRMSVSHFGMNALKVVAVEPPVVEVKRR